MEGNKFIIMIKKKNLQPISMVLLAIFICVNLSSCALIFNGTKQGVTIRSMTDDSRIYVDGDYLGTNLVNVKLRRKDNHTVIVKKEGCKTETVHIDSNVQAGWVVFDALFNWFAFLTDPTTGAWKSFDKTRITVDLECKE